MKMTMHIDEQLLARVMEITGAPSKTAAVHFALTELRRRHNLKAIFSAGLGLSSPDLKAAVEPEPAGS